MPFFQLDYISVFSVRVYTLLISCGDIYPNPSPSSSNPSISLNNSLSRSSKSSSLTEILTFDHHLSFIHYNIQSISSKLDILHSEILDFDILAFTETWLSPATPTDCLFVCFVALRPKSTAMVIAGQSVHLTTLFPGHA